MPDQRPPPTVTQMIDAGLSFHDAMDLQDTIDRYPEKSAEVWWLYISEPEGEA